MTKAPTLPQHARLSTGSTGQLAICGCGHQYPEDRLYSHAPGDSNPVVVRRDGEVTDRHIDGTEVTNEDDKEVARMAPELFCPQCKESIRGWMFTEDPHESADRGDRGDMIDYLRTVKEEHSLRIPRHDQLYLTQEIAEVMLGERDNTSITTNRVYTLSINGYTHMAYRIEGTYRVIHVTIRSDGETHHSMGAWGEACLFVRYAAVIAELENKDFAIEEIEESVIDSILKCAPEEWEDDIKSLLNQWSQTDE